MDPLSPTQHEFLAIYEDEKAHVLVWLLKEIKELEFPWNWVKKLKAFSNSPKIVIEPLDKGWDLFDTCLWGNNLKQLGRVWPEAPQWWQTWVVLELLGFLEGGLTLEVDRDLNLGQFGLVWPTIWQWWQVWTNLEFSFNLGGVLDISLETSTLTSDCLFFSILAILVFNSSLFLLNGGI